MPLVDITGSRADTPSPGCSAAHPPESLVPTRLRTRRNQLSEAKSGVLLSFLPFGDTDLILFPLLSDVDTVCLTSGPFGHPENTHWTLN